MLKLCQIYTLTTVTLVGSLSGKDITEQITTEALADHASVNYFIGRSIEFTATCPKDIEKKVHGNIFAYPLISYIPFYLAEGIYFTFYQAKSTTGEHTS